MKLGDKVRDTITDFAGIATARVEYLWGCVQFCVTPKAGSDGKLVPGEYFDADRLVMAEEKSTGFMANVTGGPSINLPEREHPPR